MDRWTHQVFGVNETLASIERGERRILLTSPTGGGKTTIMADLIESWTEAEMKVALYTNRKMLVEQTSRVMSAAGIDHGMRAAGHSTDGHFFPVQVCSLQTEDARVFKSGRWTLHDAQRALVDEAHMQKGKVARRILDAHHEEGGAYVGLTATPLGLADLYDTLIVAGTPSELRQCGALVPCHHYGPDEPDLKHIGKVALGEDLTEKQNVKAMMTHGIFGRVFEWWKTLNPEGKPTLLFAPGVAESIWFAEQFYAAGVNAAHIDGEDIWFRGEVVKSSYKARRLVEEGARDGTIKVVCNRFVMREGIDWPWIEHMIFATVFGSLQSYLQSGGRGLRACRDTGKDRLILQDHGGNWWRHGSLNADREWRLVYTPSIVAGLREEAMRSKKVKEPMRCPKCAQILTCLKCPCGYEIHSHKKSRPVIQTDGTMKEMSGDVFRPRRVIQLPDAQKIWERMYYRAKRAGMTFRQAEALFAVENNWGWPSHDMSMMPTQELDWFLRVDSVPTERLTG